MADVLAIISKAQFEKAMGVPGAMGGTFHFDRYVSSQKTLDALAGGGSLYLVTVRPPEQLWLVAVLENPKRKGDAWVAKRNMVPSTRLDALRSKLKFEGGGGINAKPGALGMSLQTPRRLTPNDVALLQGAIGGKVPKAQAEPKAKAKAAAPAKAPAKAKAQGKKLTETMAMLADAALGEIESEYLDAIAKNADAAIAKGKFSMTVQSIMSGSIESAPETLPYLTELAPLVTGPTLVERLKNEAEDEDATAVSILNELVDAFCVCAIDKLGTALVALATERPEKVPPEVAPYAGDLAERARRLRAMLDEA